MSQKKKDIAEKTFMALNDVFADIFNVLLFEGKQVITADSLEDMPSVSQYKADDEHLHEQERDTVKLWCGHGMNLVLMGVENQTKPDKDMPFRIIGYDGAAYRSQLLKKEENMVNGKTKKKRCKERYPVITVVLYFGEKPWKYPKTLKESFYPKLPEDEITKVLQNYISDYKINVFEISALSPETVKLFQSDFRIVADYFVNVKNNTHYKPPEEVIVHVDEFLKLMSVLTGDNRYENLCTSFDALEKKEGISMCKVLDEREKRGHEAGFAEGLEQGVEQGILQSLCSLVRKGHLTAEIAAEEANMEPDAFRALIEKEIIFISDN